MLFGPATDFISPMESRVKGSKRPSRHRVKNRSPGRPIPMIAGELENIFHDFYQHAAAINGCLPLLFPPCAMHVFMLRTALFSDERAAQRNEKNLQMPLKALIIEGFRESGCFDAPG